MPLSLSGLSVIMPVGLWALLALAIPVLIHLFNRSRGRLVRIGHIDLIRPARKSKLTEIKLAQWLLLLLRLGIFGLAALLLAGLARSGLERSDSPTAYVTPAWLRTVQPAAIEQLIAERGPGQGGRLFVLEPGFAPLDQAAADEIRQSPLDLSQVSNVWPLLAERLSLEHHGGPVDVYATDLLLQFGAVRPELPRPVNWNMAHPQTAPALDQPAASDLAAIDVVVAFEAERSQDAEVFRAALASLKAHRVPGLTWDTVDSVQLTEQQLNADWLIFLSENDLTADQLARINTASTVLMDATGDLPVSNLEYAHLPFYPFSTFRISGMVRNPPGSGLAQPLLTAADGWPILQEYQSGPARMLQFNSRFNPQWSSIAQQAEFPELLLQLMLTKQQARSFADARINPAQLQTGNVDQGIGTPLPRQSMQSLLVMLLALLWVAERWLSERKRRERG